jgi:O-Antigen ligase
MTERMASRTRDRSTWLIMAVLACAVLADRAVVAIASGGRGALPLLSVVAPLAAVVIVARSRREGRLGFLAHPAFVFGVLPYLALTALYPILGVLLNGYPERTLLSITEATTALSFLVIGSTLAASDERSWSPWLLVAIALQLVYAAGQAVYLSRGPGWELFAPFHAWDESAGALQGQFIAARSIGLYINPNELGLWAGIAAILAWTLLPGRFRTIGLTMAVLTLLLSQSRGATVALLAALAVGVAISLAKGRLASLASLKAVVWVGLAGLIAIVAAVALAPQGALVGRFGALLQITTQGLRADPNLAGRLDFWQAVTALNAVHPWGTFGPPELLLGSSIDSTWFRAVALGSLPYVTALAVLLVAALVAGRSRYGGTLRLVTVMVAVAGVTMDPFGYPVIVLFWVLLGAALQASLASRVPSRRRSKTRLGPAVAARR